MKEGTQEEMVMTRGLEKTDDMKEEEDGTTGGTVEMKDKTEKKKRKTRKNTRTEEMETGRICPGDEAVHGCLEEEDPDQRDQEEAHLKDREKSGLELPVLHQENRQENQETDQEDQETGQETKSSPASGS